MNTHMVTGDVQDVVRRSNAPALRLLVVSADQALIKDLAAACENDGRARMVVAVSGAIAAVEATRREDFDLALIDLDMPFLTGIGAVQMIAGSGTGCEVMVLLSAANHAAVPSAVQAGANGILTRERTKIADLVGALVSLRAGESAVSPDIARYLIRRYQRAH